MNITFNDVKQFFSSYFREKDTNKYDYGHVLIIAGSLGMIGAGILASRACMRSGVGLVTLAVPSGISDATMCHVLEEIVLPVPNLSEKEGYFDELSFKFIKNFIERKKISLVVIGPGLSRNISTIDFVKKILTFLVDYEMDIIIDADAINALSNKKKYINSLSIEFLEGMKNKKSDIIITPHYKEYQRLLNIDDINFIKKENIVLCKGVALENNLVCVLKSFNTVISDGKEVFVNVLGNSGMATAGMGDVLVGIIAGLKASLNKISMLEAAKMGVFIHSFSGDIAKNKVGEISLIARDVIENLPFAFTFFK